MWMGGGYSRRTVYRPSGSGSSPTTDDVSTSNDNDNDEYLHSTDEIPPALSTWNARPSGERRHRARSVHDLLVKWAKFAKRQSEMHDMSWAYFKSWNLSSAIISTVIVSASGLVTIGLGQRPQSCDGGESGPTSIPIIVAGAMSLVGSTIMAINKLLAYGEIQQQHDIYSDSYEIMYNDIALNMTLGKSSHRMFNNDSEFIKYLKYKMDQLIDRAPPITNYIRKQYDKQNPVAARFRRSRDQTPLVSKGAAQLTMDEAICNATKDAANADIYTHASTNEVIQIQQQQQNRQQNRQQDMQQNRPKLQQEQQQQRPIDEYDEEQSPPLARSVYSSKAPSSVTAPSSKPFYRSFVYAPPTLSTPNNANRATLPTHIEQQQQEINVESNPIFDVQLYRARSRSTCTDRSAAPLHPHPMQGRLKPLHPEYSSS